MKYKIAKLEDVAESLRQFYKPAADGDGYILQVEGAVPMERLTEFRDNNIRLKKEKEELETKFAGIDPAEYTRLKGQEDNLKKGKLEGNPDAEKLLNERTEKMTKDHAAKVAALEAESKSYKEKLENLLIVDATIGQAIGLGLLPSAKEDLATRAKAAFKLKDGKPVVYNGEAEVFGSEGKPMEVAEWLKGQITSAPHLFGKSQGGGSGNKGDSNTNVNPWDKDTFNLTLQSKIYKEDKAKAERLMAEAKAKAA